LRTKIDDQNSVLHGEPIKETSRIGKTCGLTLTSALHNIVATVAPYIV
jgi:hypothetical protein